MSGDLSEDKLVEEIARELAQELKRFVYPKEYFDCMRGLGTPSEKLVYLYIWLCQPQTFTSIKRCLNLPGMTVARALKELKEKTLIFEDKNFLYWTANRQAEGPR